MGVSEVIVLQYLRQASLLVFFIILFALAVYRLISIVFAIVGFLSALLFALLLCATAQAQALFHHGLQYFILYVSLVFLKVFFCCFSKGLSEYFLQCV